MAVSCHHRQQTDKKSYGPHSHEQADMPGNRKKERCCDRRDSLDVVKLQSCMEWQCDWVSRREVGISSVLKQQSDAVRVTFLSSQEQRRSTVVSTDVHSIQPTCHTQTCVHLHDFLSFATIHRLQLLWFVQRA